MIKQLAKTIPGLKGIIESTAYKRLRHRVSLITSDRENSTFTGFSRLPTQFEALTGPVLKFLLDGKTNQKIKLIVFGCSNGAEPYTIASVLKSECIELEFSIAAFDIDEAIVEKAKSSCYDPDEEIFNNKIITEAFINQTFDKGDNGYKVKSDIAKHVTFQIADALDTDLSEKIGTADILFAQNFLFHLKPKISSIALNNLCSLLNDRSALFIDGVDINQRMKITKYHKLMPLDYKIEEIHNEAMRARSVGWPYSYWGLEPFMTNSIDWKRRYSTVFIKNVRHQ